MKKRVLFFSFIVTLLTNALVNKVNAATVNICGNQNWSAAGIAAIDNVVIGNGATLTVDVGTAVCASVQLGVAAAGGCGGSASQGTLAFNAGGKLTVNGIVTVGAVGGAGNLNMTNGYLACRGFLVVTEGTYTSGGTVELTASNILPVAAVSAMNTFNNLTVNGGTTSLGQALTISGDVTITSGSLDVTTAFVFQITMAGPTSSWINNAGAGSFIQRTGTVIFSGTGAQSIGGTAITTFHNLTVNKPTGTLTLDQSEIIDNTGVLNLIAGPVAIDENTLTVNNGSTAAITRTAGYLISEDNSLNGNGKANNSSFVTWAVNVTTGAHVFPFGDIGGAYIPFTYNLTAGNAGNVTLATYPTNAVALVTPLPVPVTSVNDTTYKGIDDSPYTVHRFWYIASSGGTADMTFTYSNPADIGFLSGGVNGSDGTGLRAQQWNAGTLRWLRFYAPSQSFNSSNVLGGNSVTISSFSGALTSTAPWALALRIRPLPVELLSLTVSLNANKEADINWQTAQEVNNSHFVVERSHDGVNFKSVSTVNGAGNSNILINYNATDENPLGGVSYYRLKQTDFNGNSIYSPIVAVTNTNAINLIEAFPNPVESRSVIVFKSNEAMPTLLGIYDETGKLVLKQKIDAVIGTNNFTLDVSVLHSGIYNFILTFDAKTDMKYEGRFVKN